MAFKSMTGAMAMLSFRTPNKIVPVQSCNSYSIEERRDVADVVGLGNLMKLDQPTTGWSGSGSLSFYTTPFREALETIPIDNRVFQTPEEYANYLLTQTLDDGVVLSLFHRVKKPDGSYGVELFCNVGKLKVTNMSFGFDANQVSMTRYQFVYSTPILLPE